MKGTGRQSAKAWERISKRSTKSLSIMKRTNKCPKCGSIDVIAAAKTIDRADNGHLTVATFRKPDAVVFKGQLTTTLSAWVCADCGYLELYADDPKKLKVATT